tara:strand:+ start:425 stop:601 length:177 start_codon:yes stop_codon:yes gene_type:complete
MLSKQEWDGLQQLSYNVMPKWWYNTEECEARYQAYRKGYEEWAQKTKENWGQPTIDME